MVSSLRKITLTVASITGVSMNVSINTAYWFAFITYFSALFLIGLVVRKKNATSSDMMIGGRTLNFWVTALSAQASDMSSWLFMAFPMSVFIDGFSQLWSAFSLIIGMFCCWHFVAPRFREQTEYLDCNTMPSYLAKRYNDTSGAIRIVSSLACIYFLTYYVAAGLISIGLLFENIFAINYIIGISVATAAMIGYLFMGGFVSVAWVDLFQALFLLAAIVIVPLKAFSTIDGVDAIVQRAREMNVSFSLFGGGTTWKDIFFNLFAWGFGYFGMPHIITKFMGIKNPKDLVKSKYLGIAWQAIALFAAASVGLIGIAYFTGVVANPELIFVNMVQELFHPLIAGFILCGLLAATVSTMDSQLLVASSVITEDFYKQMRKESSEKSSVRVFRFAASIVSALAFTIALSRDTTIMETVYYAWAGLGASFGPIILVSLYSQYTTRNGALASMLSGCIFTSIWPTVNKFLYSQGLLGPVPALVIGFPLALAVLFLVSYLDRKKQPS